jgi:hypothetical protein
MPSPTFNRERAAQVLVLAEQFGDARAADIAGLNPKTIGRYRKRLEADAQLSELVAEKREELLAKTKAWTAEADEFMVEALRVMRQKLPTAELRDVAGAYKIVGEMKLAREALLDGGDDELDGDREGEEAPGATPGAAITGATAQGQEAGGIPAQSGPSGLH